MNFLNFNNAIINITNVNKISVQSNKIYIESDGKHYEYTIDRKEYYKIIDELHKAFDTDNNISFNVDVIDTFEK